MRARYSHWTSLAVFLMGTSAFSLTGCGTMNWKMPKAKWLSWGGDSKDSKKSSVAKNHTPPPPSIGATPSYAGSKPGTGYPNTAQPNWQQQPPPSTGYGQTPPAYAQPPAYATQPPVGNGGYPPAAQPYGNYGAPPQTANNNNYNYQQPAPTAPAYGGQNWNNQPAPTQPWQGNGTADWNRQPNDGTYRGSHQPVSGGNVALPESESRGYAAQPGASPWSGNSNTAAYDPHSQPSSGGGYRPGSTARAPEEVRPARYDGGSNDRYAPPSGGNGAGGGTYENYYRGSGNQEWNHAPAAGAAPASYPSASGGY